MAGVTGGGTDRVGVLLLHGISGSPMEFRYLETHLRSQGVVIACPDIDGLALGKCQSADVRWQAWSAGVRQAYDALAARCSSVFVGGLSAGALLALDLAATKPDRLAGLLLLAPTFVADGWAIPPTLRLFSLVQARWLARHFWFTEREPFGIKDPRIRALALKAFEDAGGNSTFRVNGLLLLEHRRLARAVKRVLADIELPSLVVHPREDDQSDLANSFLLQRRMKGVVETVVLDDSYHVVTLDLQRRVVAEAVSHFIERRAPRRSRVTLPAAAAPVTVLDRKRLEVAQGNRKV